MSTFTTINGLAAEIARREGKKSQARMGDIKEILGILSELMNEVTEEDLNTSCDPFFLLQRLAERRRKLRVKRRRK